MFLCNARVTSGESRKRHDQHTEYAGLRFEFFFSGIDCRLVNYYILNLGDSKQETIVPWRPTDVVVATRADWTRSCELPMIETDS